MNNKRFLHGILILTGNLIYALTVKLFLLPANLISAGTTGLALVVNHLSGMPISWFIFAFNVAMLIWGWWVLGKGFAMTTIFSSLFYPIALEVLDRVLGPVSITDNIMLNTLFSGMGLGLALGLVLRCGASTGGMDIPTLILKKKFNIPVSATLWIFDFVIMVSQMLFHTGEDLLYGVLLLISISVTLNKVMLLGTSKTEVKIISQHSGAIREAILSRVDRGVTILHGEGGYLHHETEVILSIISNHELPRIEQLAREIDPDSFIIVSHVTEVWGRGFTNSKRHESKNS
jgi:uncharacterized membrane-anchored protein YitT (DUF2179 family)